MVQQSFPPASHPFFYHIILSCDDVLQGLCYFCAPHGDHNISTLPENYTLFLMAITNVCFVCSEKGQNIVKRCIGTPQRAKTSPTDILEPDLARCTVKGWYRNLCVTELVVFLMGHIGPSLFIPLKPWKILSKRYDYRACWTVHKIPF